MDEERFERLWERAEAEEYAMKLTEEYPAWRMRRRRTAGIVAGRALVLAVALPLVYTPLPSSKGNEMAVYCNNSDIEESHWTEMADALLMS